VVVVVKESYTYQRALVLLLGGGGALAWLFSGFVWVVLVWLGV
jgi:hypothetical protein